MLYDIIYSSFQPFIKKEFRMTIQQCKYVLEIAKTGSFSEAAKQLFIAQSSLSVSVKMLEQELNIKIFERSSGGVYLTEDGAEFVRYAAQIAESDEFVRKRYNDGENAVRLNIVTQHYDFIADVFGKFLQSAELERYKFSIKEIETYNVVREVETASADIGILAIKDGDFDIMKRHLVKKQISFTELIDAEPHVFFRKGHPLADSASLRLPDLKDYPYVSYEQGDHNTSFFTEEISDGLDPQKHIEISDRATLMNLLLITDAYTIGTGIMPSALNKGDIVSTPLESGGKYLIGYILNDNRKISAITKEFISQLEAAAKIWKKEKIAK